MKWEKDQMIKKHERKLHTLKLIKSGNTKSTTKDTAPSGNSNVK